MKAGKRRKKKPIIMRVAETLAVLAASFLGFSEAATAIWPLEENPGRERKNILELTGWL